MSLNMIPKAYYDYQSLMLLLSVEKTPTNGENPPTSTQ